MKDSITNLELAAKNYESNQNWENAYKCYWELYQLTKNYVYLYKLGYTSSQLQNHKKSIEFYKLYLKKNNKDWTAFYNLGVEYFQINLYKESIACLKKAIQFNPDYLKSYLLLGYTYEISNNFTESKKYFQFVLKKDPHNKLAIKGLIFSLIQLKEYNTAQIICENYLKIFPDELTLKNLYTGILLELGKVNEFIEELKEITEKDERYRSFDEYLKKFQSERNQENLKFIKEVQKKLIEKTKELQKKEDKKTYLDLSIISLFSGNKENAIEYLKKAIEIHKKENP